MSVQDALEALKRKDYAAARDMIAREDASAYGIQHFLIKGLAEMALEDWASALDTFVGATKRFPDHANFWLNRGVAEENLKSIEAAIASLERCLALAPTQGEACGNLSNLYRNKRRFVEAEDMARRALINGAAKGEALNCLCLALWRQGKFDEARDVFKKAQLAAPDNPAILSNHANLEADVFNFDAAWKLFAAARAIRDKPVFRRDEGLARLLAGDFEQGFKLFEARLEMPHALRLIPSCPRWKGESLKGKKLLIIAEQGLGDVIHFCRYQKFLPEGELVWAVPKSLVRLLKDSLRGDVRDEKGPLPVCDYYVPMLSLAFYSLPLVGEGIYLTAPAAPVLPKGSRKLKIGLVWAGAPTHERDEERSLPLKLFAPLLNSIDADFYAPFVGEDLEAIGDLPVTRLDALIGDFADTAALLKQLDCLVCVDTACAHLAGALGVKTFLLLPRCPDWRWGTAGETTALYPSVTLVRQKAYGDWTGVVDKLLPMLKIINPSPRA